MAGFNVNEKQSKKIGSTSNDIVTLQPLPINQLFGYLAKQSYYIGVFEIALKAATEHINFFVEDSGVFDRTLDSQNPILYYKLKPSVLKTVSVQEINQLSESLFIKARCLRQQEKAKTHIE